MALPLNPRSPLLEMLVILLYATIQHRGEEWKIKLEGFSGYKRCTDDDHYYYHRSGRSHGLTKEGANKIIQLEGHELLFSAFRGLGLCCGLSPSKEGANEAASTSPDWCPTNKTVFFLGKVVDVFWRYPCQRVLLIVLGVAVSGGPSQHNHRHRLETILSSFNLINIYEVSK